MRLDQGMVEVAIWLTKRAELYGCRHSKDAKFVLKRMPLSLPVWALLFRNFETLPQCWRLNCVRRTRKLSLVC